MQSGQRRGANPLLARLDPADEASMRQLIGGSLKTQALYVVAKLGVADLLATGAHSADGLAATLGCHADSLQRVMRYLVTCGVFVEQDDGRFTLTSSGEYLQTAHPRSLRASAIRAGEGYWQTVGALHEAVRSGSVPHDAVHGGAYFAKMSEEEDALRFAARMGSSTPGIAEAIAAASSLRDAGTIVDVGGGHGAVLQKVLELRTDLRGVLFDTPAMIELAKRGIVNSGVAERCTFVSGDFFENVPAGDVHLLSWILHDWNDEAARRIVRSCRTAGGDGARLVLTEVERPEHAAKLEGVQGEVIADPFMLDLQMLLLTGGKERTRDEYAALLMAEGFELKSVSPIQSTRGVSLFEARALG
jgi:hypothetical protein